MKRDREKRVERLEEKNETLKNTPEYSDKTPSLIDEI